MFKEFEKINVKMYKGVSNMEEKLNELYNQCLQELRKIGIDLRDNETIGNIDIKLSNRGTKRYGCCKQEKPDFEFKMVQTMNNRRIIKYEKFHNHHIEISKWVMELNDEIIKNTIIHELIHCIPFCNNHGSEFKKYATYINEKLGYNVKRVGNPKEDYQNSNKEYKEQIIKYKYKIICNQCGQEIYRQRFNKKLITRYKCGKCGGSLRLFSESVDKDKKV